MSRACWFAAAGLPLQPLPVPVIRAPGDRGGDRGGGGADQVESLLRRLIGREVVLQVGPVLLRGRLVTAEPVILVSSEGVATLVRLEAILSVAY